MLFPVLLMEVKQVTLWWEVRKVQDHRVILCFPQPRNSGKYWRHISRSGDLLFSSDINIAAVK